MQWEFSFKYQEKGEVVERTVLSKRLLEENVMWKSTPRYLGLTLSHPEMCMLSAGAHKRTPAANPGGKIVESPSPLSLPRFQYL
jgi:hypothetical protein